MICFCLIIAVDTTRFHKLIFWFFFFKCVVNLLIWKIKFSFTKNSATVLWKLKSEALLVNWQQLEHAYTGPANLVRAGRLAEPLVAIVSWVKQSLPVWPSCCYCEVFEADAWILLFWWKCWEGFWQNGLLGFHNEDRIPFANNRRKNWISDLDG